MRFVLVLLAAVLPIRFAAAQENLGAIGFEYFGFRQMQAALLPSAAVAGRFAGAALAAAPEKVTDSYLLPRSGQRSLYSFPNDAEQNQAFLARWTKILERAGFAPGANEFQPGVISKLPYTGNDGMVVREFWAEPQQFLPKDPADLRANMEKISGAVKAAGLPIIASFTSDLGFFLPTYHLYYATKFNEKSNEEVRLRILKSEGSDAGILKKAGVQVLQQVMAEDGSIDILTVYLGREIGKATRWGDTREDIDKKVADFKKFLAEQGGTFIEAVVRDLPPGSYKKFEADLYFYQLSEKK